MFLMHLIFTFNALLEKDGSFTHSKFLWHLNEVHDLGYLGMHSNILPVLSMKFF